MSDTELLELRRRVRRDHQISDSAARLFSEVVDLAMLDGGCFASPTQLGAWLGMSERTIRRRRDELKEAGYLRVEPSERGRQLIPCNPDGQECQTDVTDKSGQTTEVTDKSGQNEVDKSGQHIENNNTHERGRAPAREDGEDDTPEEVFTSLVKIWRSVSNAPPVSQKIEDVLWGWAQDEKIPDVGLFRDVLEEQAANTTSKGCGLSPGILLREYRDQLQSGKLEPWQQESDDWSVNEQGKVCFKGVPVEETGPQNLAADLEGSKDGAPSEPPEVSA
mgnify:CR=1 FL=1